MLKKHLIAPMMAIALISSSCTSFTNTKLPLPVEPEYPKISREKLKCLDKETYKSLVKRDVMKSNQIRKLENVIRSTQ